MFIAGGIVTGDNFFGRAVELDSLKIFFSGLNNYALTGLSRVGKSSLVSELLIRMSESIASNNIKIVKFSLTSSTQENKIFRHFFMKILDATKCLESESLKKEAEAIIVDLENDYIDEKRVIELSDQLFDKTGIKFCLIIDEFDYAPDVFRKHLMTLREFITNSKNIKLLTISRTSLAKLFPLGGDGSVFPGAFVYFPLKGFSNDDVAKFRQRVVEGSGKNVNDDIWCSIGFYAGNFPFNLALWCNAYLDVIHNDMNAMDDQVIINRMSELCSQQTDDFLDYQCQALKRLGEFENLKKFIDQASAVGNIINKEEFRTLNSYGVISLENLTVEQPYLKAFLSKRPDSRIDYSELNQLVPVIETLIADCDSKLTSLFGSTKSNGLSKIITKYRRDLYAIKIKIDGDLELSNLGAFIAPVITDSEINLYKQKISDCRNYIYNV